jgi:hypothetical protein
MIIVLYTGDCLLYAQDTPLIDSFLKTLRDDYTLTLKDPYLIDDFLGIHFSHQDNGEPHMSQTGLIDAVTESAHIPKRSTQKHPNTSYSNRTRCHRRPCRTRILELSIHYRKTQLSCTKLSARHIIFRLPMRTIL